MIHLGGLTPLFLIFLEKFAVHFNDLYGDRNARFIEEEGRKYFLLYLRPIINGTGNYYIESRTRGMGRTDVIVDDRSKQYVIEMKVSFNFNKNKKVGVHEIAVGDKLLIEAVV